MSIFRALFLGLVQGIAEFLPISSSGHLSIFQNFFGMENPEQGHLMFDVMLHFGTLISVFIVYRREIWEMIIAIVRLFRSLGNGGGAHRSAPTPAGRLVIMIITATLPLFVILPLSGYIEQLYYNTTYIGFALLITGCLLFVSDKIVAGYKTERNATVKDAVIIGLAQAMATVPGLSRSGTTISVGLLRGLDREYAVKFSFLMSIPAILGATLISLVKALKAGFDTSMLPTYLAGVVVAAVVGYFAIKLVRALSIKGKFGKFSYYCWSVGILTIIVSIIL